MTINQAIEMLTALQKRHGTNIDVFFDCPHCGTSFAPNKVVAEAIHITQEKKSDD